MTRTRRAVADDSAVARVPVSAARAALGAGGLAIIVADIVLTVRAAPATDLGNYFAQFTILSVLFASVLMLLGAAVRREPAGMVHLRAMAMTALGVAAVLHATLLGGQAGLSGEVVNALLHIVFPVLALMEWVGVRSRGRTRWFTPLIGLAFPVVFLAGTLVRGALVGWYPYDFVDPGLQGGYGGLISSLAIVLVAFLVIGAVVTLIGMLRDRVARAR